MQQRQLFALFDLGLLIASNNFQTTDSSCLSVTCLVFTRQGLVHPLRAIVQKQKVCACNGKVSASYKKCRRVVITQAQASGKNMTYQQSVIYRMGPSWQSVKTQALFKINIGQLLKLLSDLLIISSTHNLLSVTFWLTLSSHFLGAVRGSSESC